MVHNHDDPVHESMHPPVSTPLGRATRASGTRVYAPVVPGLLREVLCRFAPNAVPHEREGVLLVPIDDTGAAGTPIPVSFDGGAFPALARGVMHALARHVATGVVLVHRHDSSWPGTTLRDHQLGVLADDLCRWLGIRFVDHVIVGDDGYFSYRERGLLGHVQCTEPVPQTSPGGRMATR